MQPTNKSPYRLDFLLALRGILAFTIIMHHYSYDDYLNRIFSTRFFVYLAPDGSYSIYGFFVLSGYLMAKILTTKYNYTRGTLHFYFNRLTRIVPLYYFAIIISLFAYSTNANFWVKSTNPENLLSTIFFIANYGNIISNSSLWSISTEVQFYIIAPLILILIKTKNIKQLLAIYLCVLVLSFLARLIYLKYIPFTIDGIAYRNLEVNLIFFITGWISYLIRDRLPKINPWMALSALLLLIGIIWICVQFLPKTLTGIIHSPLWFFYTPFVVSLVTLILLPSMDREIKTTPATPLPVRALKHVLFFLGITSFSSYVIHNALKHFLYAVNPVLRDFPIPLTIKLYIFCFLVYLFIEKPFFRIRIRTKK